MAGYQPLKVLLAEELDQLIEEGFELNKEELLLQTERSRGEDLMKLYESFKRLPKRKDYPYTEPESFEETVSRAKALKNPRTLGEAEFKNKLLGAWNGRCIGCALGQPVEGWSREIVRKWCEGAGKYPIRGYIPTRSPQSGLTLVNDACTDERLRGMPSDDDIRFTALALDLLEHKGSAFDTWDVGENWLEHLQLRFVCTAETQSYLNFANLDCNGPWKAKPQNAAALARGCAGYLNPYREWIGAQIRVDAYAYAAAGNPNLAARMAYEDASFSHVKNGVYGAVFFAALISCAFVCEKMEDALECALTYVPRGSRFYEIAQKAMEIGRTAKNDEALLDRVLELGQGYNWVHTLNNAAIDIAALTYARGDFEKTVTLAVTAGLDTDCNGATAGSAAGAFCDFNRIPKKFTAPLCDTLRSDLPNYHPIAITELAERTYRLAQRFKNNGGR